MIPLSKSKKLVALTIKASTSISTTAKFSDEKLPFIPFSQRVQEKNVYSCSSMINGFAMHGRARSAIELFEEMVKTNNSVTFLGATVVCSRNGGRRVHIQPNGEAMLYSVSPSVHGGLALEKRRTMPMEPNAGVWGAVLGACSLHANLTVAAKSLLKLESTNVGKLHAAMQEQGKWEVVLRVWRLVRVEEDLRKNPAISWVEREKGVIHEFSM